MCQESYAVSKPKRKLHFEKEARYYSKIEAFESKIQNNICPFLPHYLTL